MKKNKTGFLEWCNNCKRYTMHIRTSSDVIRCIECGHGKWD